MTYSQALVLCFLTYNNEQQSKAILSWKKVNIGIQIANKSNHRITDTNSRCKSNYPADSNYEES